MFSLVSSAKLKNESKIQEITINPSPCPNAAQSMVSSEYPIYGPLADSMDCWSLLLLYSSSQHVPSTVGNCALWQHTMQLRATTWLRLHLMKANFVNTW